MSKVFLIYDSPLDASLRYSKQVHSKDLGPRLWQVILKASISQSETFDGSREVPFLLSETLLSDQCGSRFLSNKTVQAVYEVGRVCGVDAELPDEMGDMDDAIMGVFYIR